MEDPERGCPGYRAHRLKRELDNIPGYWSRVAREKGILSDEGLDHFLEEGRRVRHECLGVGQRDISPYSKLDARQSWRASAKS